MDHLQQKDRHCGPQVLCAVGRMCDVVYLPLSFVWSTWIVNFSGEKDPYLEEAHYNRPSLFFGCYYNKEKLY